jgi:hypothetical protein
MADDELPPESQNPVKDPEDWVTGDEPMTGPQASYLKTLLQQAGKEDDFDPHWTKAEASRRIDELQQETGPGARDGDAGRAARVGRRARAIRTTGLAGGRDRGDGAPDGRPIIPRHGARRRRARTGQSALSCSSRSICSRAKPT